MLRTDLSFKHLGTQTRYAHAQWEQSLIMLPSENTGLDFSLEKNSNAHAVYIPLNQGDIFFMIIVDLMAIEIQDKTFSATLLCFWRLILMCLLF